jgi:HEAT repeat protein
MGISMLEEFAKDSSSPVQAACAQLLAQDDSSRTFAELRDALGDKNWTVRAASARALAKINDWKAVPQLKDMMENDKARPVRFVAAAAILWLSRGHTHGPGPISHMPLSVRTAMLETSAKTLAKKPS